MNKPDDAHFEQANERLKVLCQRWYDGQIDQQSYRAERQDILDFLTGHAPSISPDLPQIPHSTNGRRKRWWWPLGK